MYWHPNGNYLAATVCDTYQNFFINNPNTLEVLDHNSDIVIYDVKKNEVFSCEALNSKDSMANIPCVLSRREEPLFQFDRRRRFYF